MTVARESDRSQMRSKVSSDWLPGYIMATDQFMRYSKWLDTFWTDLIHVGSTDPDPKLCCAVTRADNTTDMFNNSQKWFD
jgi:hypothetical protein